MSEKIYGGSCHCRAVEFEAKVDLGKITVRCNCSICWKARSWFAPMPLENLRLLKGESDLTEYSWVPDDKPKANLHYRFCKHCGIRVFARGDDNGHGEPFYGVAISTLEGTDADELVASLTYIDGANDKFDSRPDDIRLM